MKNFNPKRQCLKIAGIAAALVAGICSLVWASTEGGHGGVHNSWLTVDTWKVLNFGILAVALFVIGKKPVKEFFSSRAKSIEDELNELEQKKAEAVKELAEYQAKFRNLDQESKQIVEDYIQQGQDAKKRILAEAEAQAAKLEDMAKRNIEQEFKAARTQLQQEIAEKAMEKAEEIIKGSISSEDQDKLVDDYLKKVVA
ncbi:ATP synthase F0 subunit B [Desulfospira joergensenii]|uniref:F0F1 ATP synthase subunit B family protein n=1 Tax=Desulfospira joergensenii TaxID=53329 RepID=UPI0003B353E2|nr:ATP synthase F0 subunit B [Desulfospira joergensenii]